MLVRVGGVVLLGHVVEHQHVCQCLEAVRERPGDIDRGEVVVADVLAERLAALPVERDYPGATSQTDEQVVLAPLVVVKASDRPLC